MVYSFSNIFFFKGRGVIVEYGCRDEGDLWFFFGGGEGTVAQTQEMKGGSFTPHFFLVGGYGKDEGSLWFF